jgi:hypothetical protein
MEHKAYEFDWDNFDTELRPILEQSLSNDQNMNLYTFINANREYLTDPYEGEPLDEDWEEKLETRSTQELGDFALTKYYEFSENYGLSDNWLPLQDELSQKLINALLGTSISSFDPGCYGSYFQSSDQRKENAALLLKSSIGPVKEFAKYLNKLNKGVYVTF